MRFPDDGLKPPIAAILILYPHPTRAETVPTRLKILYFLKIPKEMSIPNLKYIKPLLFQIMVENINRVFLTTWTSIHFCSDTIQNISWIKWQIFKWSGGSNWNTWNIRRHWAGMSGLWKYKASSSDPYPARLKNLIREWFSWLSSVCTSRSVLFRYMLPVLVT